LTVAWTRPAARPFAVPMFSDSCARSCLVMLDFPVASDPCMMRFRPGAASVYCSTGC
jgi:hypothetical protein